MSKVSSPAATRCWAIEFVQGPGALQGPHLDQDRDRPSREFGQPAGELAEEERLAVAEVGQHEDESPVLIGEPAGHGVEDVAGGVLGQDGRPDPDAIGHPLGDIETSG